MVCSASLAQHLLQTARPLVPSVPAGKTCTHPTKPAPLRRLCQFQEPCIELLVSTSSGHPCCVLPDPALRATQVGGLYRLIRLDTLRPETLVDALAAVEGHVSNTCATCPTFLEQQQQLGGRTSSGGGTPSPSPLCYCPEFACFLERCLELAQTNKQLGAAPSVLLLQIVSRLNFAADPSLRENFSRFYLHMQVGLEEAVELHTEAITPQVVLAVQEAWAAMGAKPMKTSTFGHVMREQLKGGMFTPQELSRLLAAIAAQRAANPSYRPNQYDVCDIAAGLRPNLRELASPHLTSVAASLAHFPWPVYQCVLPLLEDTASEGVRRMAVGTLSAPAGTSLVAAAVGSAAALNPRLGAELEAKAAGWKAQARLCAGGNILSWAGEGAAGAEEKSFSACV